MGFGGLKEGSVIRLRTQAGLLQQIIPLLQQLVLTVVSSSWFKTQKKPVAPLQMGNLLDKGMVEPPPQSVSHHSPLAHFLAHHHRKAQLFSSNWSNPTTAIWCSNGEPWLPQVSLETPQIWGSNAQDQATALETGSGPIEMVKNRRSTEAVIPGKHNRDLMPLNLRPQAVSGLACGDY